MKIALVCRVYPSQRPGGMGFVCQDRARALVQLGHEVHVLTTGKNGDKGSQLDDQGVEVHHLPCVPVDYSTEFTHHLRTHVKSFSPAILHLDSFDSSRPWWREIMRNDMALALTMHGFCWGTYMTRLNEHMRWGNSEAKVVFDTETAMRERSYMLDFHTVIGISLHEQWMMMQLMGLHDAKLVYNPISEHFFSSPRKPLPSGPKRFLCAAISGHDTRGFKYAERAAKEAGVELVIAQNVSRDNMPELIDSCHGLVLPTAYAQGLDLTVGEAIIRHRPVIATATGSYLREASPEGIYTGFMDLIPLVNPAPSITEFMKLPSDHFQNFRACSPPRPKMHYPKQHAENWLQAILG